MTKNKLNMLVSAAVVAAAAAAIPVTANAAALLGTDLASFSILAGGYATYGASATVSGPIGAVSYVVGGAGSSSGGDIVNKPQVVAGLAQLASAQAALNAMPTTTTLAPTVSGNVTYTPGVYSAPALVTAAGSILTLDGGGASNPTWVFNIPTYLVTGAGTQIKIINSGTGASVLWNTGGYAALGASTMMLGTILSGAYISEGGGATMGCGNVYSQSYISVPAGSNVTSTNCLGTGSWAGSPKGLGMGLDIVGGVAVASAAPVVAVPEPQTYAMLMLGLGVVAFKVRRNKQSDKT